MHAFMSTHTDVRADVKAFLVYNCPGVCTVCALVLQPLWKRSVTRHTERNVGCNMTPKIAWVFASNVRVPGSQLQGCRVPHSRLSTEPSTARPLRPRHSPVGGFTCCIWCANADINQQCLILVIFYKKNCFKIYYCNL